MPGLRGGEGRTLKSLCAHLREQSELTRRCVCGWQTTGTYADTRDAFKQHKTKCRKPA